jgi:aspartate kinase
LNRLSFEASLPESPFNIYLVTNVVKIILHDVPNRPGIAAEIFIQLNSVGINVELVVLTTGHRRTTDLAIAVLKEDISSALRELNRLRTEMPFKDLTQDDQIALITLERENLIKVSGAAARMFRAIAAHKINIDLISTSLHSITCLIAKERADDAYRALREEFETVEQH